jgi:hypothetical protein
MTKKKVSALIAGTLMTLLMITAVSCTKTKIKPTPLTKDHELLKVEDSNYKTNNNGGIYMENKKDSNPIGRAPKP